MLSLLPNLILLYIVTIEPLCDENGVSLDQEDCRKYKDTVSKTFSYHKLLTTGDFVLTDSYKSLCYSSYSLRNETLSHYFNSFW